MNKKFQKRLNELGKLSGYQKPIQIDDVLKLDSNENLAIKKEFQMELMVKNAKTLSKEITGPGLVLIGNNTPSSASDYLLGTNHILPTNGFGRTRGGLSVLDFLKLQTIVETKKSDLSKISDNLKILTDAEGLPNHYKAVERRLKWIKNSKKD